MDDNNKECGGARWASYVVAALEDAGWLILRSAGSSDYQGSGCLLAQRDEEWAAYAWSYGSCGGCDQWEDREQCLADEVLEALDIVKTKEQATARYEEIASRIW